MRLFTGELADGYEAVYGIACKINGRLSENNDGSLVVTTGNNEHDMFRVEFLSEQALAKIAIEGALV